MTYIQKLDSFHLKIIAMLTMLIDHIGAFLSPNLIILRIIGRISFILYAFLLVEAMRYSKHKIRYIIILFSFEIVLSLIEYLFTFEYNSTIFSLLALSSLTIYLLDSPKKTIKLLAIFPILYVIFATFNFTFFKVEYGIYGLIVILGFYFIRKSLEMYLFSNDIKYEDCDDNLKKMFHNSFLIGASLVVLTTSMLSFLLSNYLKDLFPNNYFNYQGQSQAILAIPFILLYSGKRGFDNKYFRLFTYSFYPIHILILYILAYFFTFR